MRTERDGGRHAPFSEGYCPHLIADGTDCWLAVRASLCPGPVAPGETAEVRFELTNYPSLDYSALAEGSGFTIREGSRAVGSGTVLAKEQMPSQ
jgi:translation elongation factor EF-Tu-like GTPase